ncbi:MAG: prefoldin subunit alpha [Candidatus Aenigmarchaeota archaeon]|nr:prefoldin subunit alpha [Candidatus Aenigmarchaeota archaeon]
MATIAKGQEERILIMQLLRQRFEELRSQAVLVEKGFMEVESTNACLDEMKGLEGEKDILVPLGSGAYGRASLKGKQDVLVNIGAGVLMELDLGKSSDFVAERKKEMEQAAKVIQSEMEQIAEAISKIASEYQHEQESDSINVLRQSSKK